MWRRYSIGMQPLLLLAVLGEEKEQWNGPANTPRCTNKLKSWTEDFAAGERAITMSSRSYVCDGNDCDVVGAFSPKYSFMCATKGAKGAGSTLALDPVVDYTMIGVTSEFHSGKPCKFLAELGVGEGMAFTPRKNQSGEVGGGNGGCVEPSTDECEYPKPPPGLTTLPHTGQELDKWPGLLMDMGNLNQANPHLNHESWAAGEAFQHRLPYGVEGSVCDDSVVDANGKMVSAVGAERAFYNGGVLIEKTRGPATTRSYMFKSDADRARAVADDRNRGLKFAKTFTGDNGCDTEVVWEVTPKSGGGIDMELTVPIDATSCETESALRNAVHVYYTGEEVVVLVTRKALKEASFLNSSCGASGYKELLRFAANFVCKTTEQSVAATVKFFNDANTEYTIGQLSTDPNNPTPYFTGTGVNYLGAGGRCVRASPRARSARPSSNARAHRPEPRMRASSHARPPSREQVRRRRHLVPPARLALPDHRERHRRARELRLFLLGPAASGGPRRRRQLGARGGRRIRCQHEPRSHRRHRCGCWSGGARHRPRPHMVLQAPQGQPPWHCQEGGRGLECPVHSCASSLARTVRNVTNE